MLEAGEIIAVVDDPACWNSYQKGKASETLRKLSDAQRLAVRRAYAGYLLMGQGLSPDSNAIVAVTAATLRALQTSSRDVLERGGQRGLQLTEHGRRVAYYLRAEDRRYERVVRL